MDKMRMESLDFTTQNVEKIGVLFPNCITETIDENGKPKKAINFELLRQMLSGDVIDGDEAYEFTWVGKKAAVVEANKPIRKTLRPCVEESKCWNKTENLYIEGDNLEVLKLLQESYLGKVKMIYIDPPYNTGNDFIYNDDFKMTNEEYSDEIGEFDDEENRMFKNTDSNGRFHSDWCSMIYPRIMLARNMLADDGIMFVSIDDNEVQNMRKICDEVFGESNFIACIAWQKIHSIKNDAKYFSENHEYALVYAKQITNICLNLLPRTKEMNNRYKNIDNDPRGEWQSGDLVASGERSKGHFAVISPKTGKTFDVPQGKHWVYSQENMLELIADNRIWFGEDGNSFPRKKRFLAEVQAGRTPNTMWLCEEVGHNQTATKEVKALFNEKLFDFPKPIDYIKQMILISSSKNCMVMDFFSGSATTAHATMQLNAEDGGNRKFIMVQLPEPCSETSEAYKAGYQNICEIGKERIRRAGDKIKAENSDATENLDIGFRVLKLDDSNMKDVYYSADEYNQNILDALESNIKEDRTDLDLLFGCLLEWGIPLSLPYSSEITDGCMVHNYNDGDLIACFDEAIPNSVVKTIARKQPLRAVFRDSGFENSPSKINVGEVFKMLSPDTRIKIL